MKPKLLILPLMIAAVAMMVAVPVFAQGRGHGNGQRGMGMGMGMGPGGMGSGSFWDNPEIQKELGLTDAQTDQLEQIGLAAKHEAIDLIAGLKETQLDMKTTMQADTIDVETAKRAADAVAEAQLKLTYHQIEVHAAQRAVLTSEQIDKLDDLRPEKKRQRRGNRRGQGGGQGRQN
jgi:Spy/CpxP family protein refolding chaperone